MPSFSTSELIFGFYSIVILTISGIALYQFAHKTDKENGNRKSLALFLFVLLTFCCISSWVLNERSRDPSPRWKPAIQDIAGVYYPIIGSSKLLTEIGYKNIPSEYLINFNADGTFTAANLPDIIWNPNSVQYKYGMAEGAWKLEDDSINGEWGIKLHLTKVNDGDIDIYSNIGLSGKKPPFLIYFPLGELDWFMYEKH